DAEQHPRAALLDLQLLLREEQEHEVDDEVGALQRVHRRVVAGQRRRADRPGACVAEQRGRRLRQPHVVGRRPEPQRGRHERVGVVEALVELRQHRDGLALTDPAQLELPGAEVDEGGRGAHVWSPIREGVVVARYAIASPAETTSAYLAWM